MSILQTTEGALMRPLGPLPLWGWAGIGGVSFFLFRAIKAHGASTAGGATAPATGGTTTPPATGGGGGTGGGGTSGGGSQYPPVTLQPGQSIYDPSTGNTSTAPAISAKDLLGGNVGDLLGRLGPNYTHFNFTAGNTGVDVANSAQNILDEQNIENQRATLNAANKDYYDYVTNNNAIATQGQTDWWNSYYDYIKHSQDVAGAAGTDWWKNYFATQQANQKGQDANAPKPVAH